MPNHCMNVLRVRKLGNAYSSLMLLHFRKKAAKGDNGPLSFANFIPEPGSKLPAGMYKGVLATKDGKSWVSPLSINQELPKIENLTISEAIERVKSIGFTVEEKHYRTLMTGGADKIKIVDPPEPPSIDLYDFHVANWGTKWDAYDIDLQIEQQELTYVFSTAWSPPIPIVHAMQQQHPGLSITLRYEEGGMAFMGGVTETGEQFDKEYPRFPDYDEDDNDSFEEASEKHTEIIHEFLHGG